MPQIREGSWEQAKPSPNPRGKSVQIYKFVDGGDNTMFSFTTDEKG
jgi:hypothetical protein